jgi:hypothetical protein
VEAGGKRTLSLFPSSLPSPFPSASSLLPLAPRSFVPLPCNVPHPPAWPAGNRPARSGTSISSTWSARSRTTRTPCRPSSCTASRAEAARALDEGAQLGMREVLLADEVDRIIAKRLRLPSLRDLAPTPREECERVASARTLGGCAPTRHCHAGDSATAQGRRTGIGGRCARGGLSIVSRGERLRGDGDRARAVAVVNRVLRAARDAGLTEKVRGFRRGSRAASRPMARSPR